MMYMPPKTNTGERDVGVRRSGWKPFGQQGWRGLAVTAGLMAVAAACSDHTSRATVAGDGGRSDGGSDAHAVSADGQANADAGQSADLATETSRGPETQTSDDASSPPGGDGGQDSGRRLDAGTDFARSADAATDAGRREDTGNDIGRASADAQPAGDSGPASRDADPSSATDADPCSGGTTYADSTSAKTTVNEYGWVRLAVASSNKIVQFDTTMLVPETPAASGTLFLWPGLQPVRGGANYAALDNGVLQPVLTWGGTCAPNSPAQPYKSWWISGQYVNTNITSSSPNYAAYNGCLGGPGMNVAVGDTLDMRLVLNGTIWTQTVTNRRNSQSVSYALDMLGQAQGSAEFVIEEYSSKPVSDVIFTSSVITFASAAKSSCQPAQRGANDYFSAPRASADGLRCCIDKVTLRAEGVAATTPNSP
jgi:hypothetical protein